MQSAKQVVLGIFLTVSLYPTNSAAVESAILTFMGNHRTIWTTLSDYDDGGIRCKRDKLTGDSLPQVFWFARNYRLQGNDYHTVVMAKIPTPKGQAGEEMIVTDGLRNESHTERLHYQGAGYECAVFVSEHYSSPALKKKRMCELRFPGDPLTAPDPSEHCKQLYRDGCPHHRRKTYEISNSSFCINLL